MISGESGTGKELFAKILHTHSKRKASPFVAINMAAIPKDLIENELFGHEKGSYTGAFNRKSGKFEDAEGGTLFLDEIGDMPYEAQTRLLRVLQEGEFTRVGGNEKIKTNVRIITATHRNLNKLVEDGVFREDLFYRLNVFPINLPPLRSRLSDLKELVNHFLSKSHDEGLDKKIMLDDAIEELKNYNWPGNIRELENFIRRMVVLIPSNKITKTDIEKNEMTQPAVSIDEKKSDFVEMIKPKKDVLIKNKRVSIETPALNGSINLKGAILDDLTLLNYKVSLNEDSDNIDLFSPDGTSNPYYIETGWKQLNNSSLELPNIETNWKASSSILTPENNVILMWKNSQDITFKITYEIDNNYMFIITQEILNKSNKNLEVYPYRLIKRINTPKTINFLILHE